ncbi:unnamed protein product [Rodentolepis nana]|uniref:Uncharacterized protein n=1 Tax=Rodentolepis nana TaxID=102285 RepID=A0A0R3TD88_RODNA|nr:unnamed protein product [Rodentolepis nana]
MVTKCVVLQCFVVHLLLILIFQHPTGSSTSISKSMNVKNDNEIVTLTDEEERKGIFRLDIESGGSSPFQLDMDLWVSVVVFRTGHRIRCVVVFRAGHRIRWVYSSCLLASQYLWRSLSLELDTESGGSALSLELDTESGGSSPFPPLDTESGGSSPFPPLNTESELDTESGGSALSLELDTESGGSSPFPPLDTESGGSSPFPPLNTESGGSSPFSPVENQMGLLHFLLLHMVGLLRFLL